MKKVLIIFALGVLLCYSANAQLTHKGVRFGLGTASVADDQLTKSPILGVNLGVYANYGFENASSFWADNLYLQFGANLTRRGTGFEQVLNGMLSYREGYYHNYYLDVPVMACWRYELPLAQADHWMNFYVGPSFGVGLMGRLWDRKVTPGNPQTSVNYDTYVTGEKDARNSFKLMRRFDVSIQLGVGYKHGNMTVDLFWEHGFMPLMSEKDVLRQLAINQNGGNTDVNTTNSDGTQTTNKINNRNAYTGTNQAFILSIGYQIPWD